jgi:hypothetical protein
LVNRSTALRDRQRLLPLHAAEVHWRIVDQSPTVPVDLDYIPFRIANVEIDFAFAHGGAQIDFVPLAFEFRMRGKGPDCRLHRSQTRHFQRLHLVKKLQQ